MITHLRRSVVAILFFTVFFGFVYAFVGTGVAQLFFKNQADGSITANGSTLIGQNWSQAKCPGHPLGSCVFQGRPDALGPYAGSAKPVAGGGTTRSRPTTSPANPASSTPASPRRPTSGPAPRPC